ncbi:hypothetical protein BLNAU_6239 [Blattamonas nauphoetae]|uniref:DUF4817 domain-containing protein n=1 Tax=Blattamonas nauphoetae TaxID=2049346 RepID=A0ABQ9Y4R8_9EUKA|nr:hypothetical protein BLNAU_6239 [Blattamonas nauphoetae]
MPSCTVCEGPRIHRMPRRLTKNERVHAIKFWYRHRDVTMVLQHWEHPHRPDRRTIQNLVRRFESTGSTADRLRPGRPRTIQTPANRERIERDVENHPTQSIRQRSTDVQLTYDYIQRRQFSLWLLAKDQVDPLFIDRIWFTDESRDDPRTMPQLEQLIREAVATLSLDSIRNACRSVVQRYRRSIEREGNSVEL